MCLVRTPGTGLTHPVQERPFPTSGTTVRYKDASQTVPATTDTTVLFPAAGVPDSGVVYDSGTGEFTVVTEGDFTVSWTAAWAADVTGTRSTWLETNTDGTRRFGHQSATAVGVATPFGQSSCVAFSALPASTFRIRVLLTGAGSLDMLGTNVSAVDVTLININRATNQ
jgi:hypothetical protein